MIEQEVKLRFDSPEAARHAVLTAGGRLVHVRRLIDDQLFDTAANELRLTRRALRVRRDGTVTYLTFKGAPIPGVFKAREENETNVGDAKTLVTILTSLGYTATWRAQKYREEYLVGDAKIAIDETPMGTFVEIEGSEADITSVAGAIGRTAGDYIVRSYVRLYTDWCRERGLPPNDMLMEPHHGDTPVEPR